MRSKYLVLSTLALLLVVLVSCATPHQVDDISPPTVIKPLGNLISDYDPGRPIVVAFNQPMDRVSTESATELEPAVPFTIQWRDDTTMELLLSHAERGRTYQLAISQKAQSRDGVELVAPVAFSLQMAEYSEVSTVQPAPESSAVPLDAVITVVFNRPVVALTTESNKSALPQPLSIEPPVEGTGEWVNTAIYRFTPKQLLLPSTTYVVTIARDWGDDTGVLEEAYTWSFTTVPPSVKDFSPRPIGGSAVYSSHAVPTDPIKIVFAQPMDKESVEEGLFIRLVGRGVREDVKGTVRWSGDTLIFTPTNPWPRGSAVHVILEGAIARGGAELESLSWTFSVIDRFTLVDSNPADGATNVYPGTSLRLTFSAPVDEESLEEGIKIEPESDWMYLHWDSDRVAYVEFTSFAGTDYIVTISGEVKDVTGWELGTPVTIRFSTGDYDPSMALLDSWQPWAFGPDDKTNAFVSYRNIERVDFALYELSRETFVRLNSDDWQYRENFSPSASDLLRTWSVETDAKRNEWGSMATPLGEDGEPLAPGLYYITASTPQIPNPPGWQRQRQVIIVSANNVTLKTAQKQGLIWITGWNDGLPKEGLAVTVFDPNGKNVGGGETDESGLVMTDLPEQDSWLPFFAFVGEPGSDDFGVTTSQWNSGISPWKYDIYQTGYSSHYSMYLYTDRDIYRPGQTVYFKGILRQDNDARYLLPEDIPSINLVATDAQGQEISRQSLKLNDMGTFSGSLELAEGAPLGFYNLWASSDVFQEGGGAYFQVAEYRRPEYEVSVAADSDEYIQGDNINVAVASNYYFGGAVADADVRWTVLTTDYFFNWQGEGYYDFTDYNYWQRWRYYGSYGEMIAEGKGKTDSEGRFIFSLPADIGERDMSQILTIEATVTDVNNQEVSSRTSVIIHKGAFYIGLRPSSYVGRAEEENTVEVITVNSQSEPVSGQEVEVVFYDHRWYNVQEKVGDGYVWKTNEEDIEVARETVESDKQGKATASFVPETPGSYKVVATSEDEFGNAIRTSTFLWISGAGYVSWPLPEDNTIQLITDKKSYEVGETAQVLIPSSYEGAVKALFTIERGKVLDYRVIDVESSSQIVEVPIKAEYAPNVYIVALLMRGADEETALPPFQIGFASATVGTKTLEIDLSIEPDKQTHYQPGEIATFKITAKDYQGRPLEAEFSLNVVDKSVMALADLGGTTLVQHFYGSRGLGVQTALTMTISTAGLQAQVGEGKGGGGGGGGPSMEVREEFPETAFWQPAVRTDSKGEATVPVTLPDNLTTWVVEAKAITADTLVAEQTAEILSTKDLLLRPVLPRFLVTGDQATISAVAHNNTDERITVEVSCDVEGLDATLAAQSVTIEAHGKQSVSWDVEAETTGEATITFFAESEEYQDAVRQRLPVYPLAIAEVVATSGQVDAGETVQESVVVPSNYEEGDLTIQVEASLAASMIPGLNYLKHYPYECIEQTMSRFLPNVVTARALQELGREDPAILEGLAEQVAVGLQRVYNKQHDDGGWGWWYNDNSNPYLSAYVTFGLAKARDAGYSVDDNVIERAIAFLINSLNSYNSKSDSKYAVSADGRAYIAYVLAEAGEGDLGTSVNLYENRESLSNRGKAHLLMALAILSPKETGRLDNLISDLAASAVVNPRTVHWEDGPQLHTMGTDVVSTAFVVQALSRVEPDHPLLANAVRWLMSTRQGGRWRSTYETATTILALTDFLLASGELEGNYAWTVAVNDQEEGSGAFDETNLTDAQEISISIADLLLENSVDLSRSPLAGTDAGRMYYSLALRYYANAEDVEAVNSGIIVTREYSAADDPEVLVEQATVNDMVRVKITIIAPNDLFHVVVEDPLPAGCEGVDTSLRTTTVVGVQPESSREGDPWGWWWFSHTEVRDDKVLLFATYLPKGTYEYVYYMRASVPGEFNVRPVNAYQMYYPEVFGHSEAKIFTVAEAPGQ